MMAHIFPLHINSSLAKRSRNDSDQSWRECKSFPVYELINKSKQDDGEEKQKKRKKKTKKHFKFQRTDGGDISLSSVRELKKIMKRKKYRDRSVVVTGTIVEGEAPTEEGDYCPFRSLRSLGPGEERLRLSDGKDIILLLQSCEKDPAPLRITQGHDAKNAEHAKNDALRRTHNATERMTRSGNESLSPKDKKEKTKTKDRGGEEFWESGMEVGDYIQCNGVVGCEEVPVDSLYRGDHEDADIFMPKGTIRVYTLRVNSWSKSNEFLLPAPPSSSSLPLHH